MFLKCIEVVSILHPFDKVLNNTTLSYLRFEKRRVVKDGGRRKKFSFCFFHSQVLSGQKLSEFRDKFPCSLEKTCYGEFSARPDSHLRAPTYRYKFPSGCFFIEGIFYDDLREPGAVRLSDTIVRLVPLTFSCPGGIIVY